MSHFDFTEEDEGNGFETPLSDKKGPIVLDDTLDSVRFRFWFDGDEAAARIRTAVITQEDPAIVLYVNQIGDLNGNGVLKAQWLLDIVSTGQKLGTFPVRYDIAPLVGP